MPNPPAGPDAHPDPPVPAPTDADRRLDAALRSTPKRYSAGYEAAWRELEAAVGAVAGEVRARGLGPEKMLVILKAHVAAHAAHPAAVLDDVVRWCIAQYYAPVVAGDAPARAPATDPHL